MLVFSNDIETNGLAAGITSMISLGSAAIDLDTNEIVARFKVNIEPLPDLAVDQNTMNWWLSFPDAYRAATENAWPAEAAMLSFQGWVRGIAGHYDIDKPIGAAWKPGFDMAFIRYYLWRFTGGDVFGRAGSGLDIKTTTAIALGKPFNEVQIAEVPAEWRQREAHDHDALGDAIEQAHVLYHACKKLGWMQPSAKDPLRGEFRADVDDQADGFKSETK